MKQVLQNLKNGDTLVEEIPCPRPGRGQLLIATTKTLVSAGTERMLVDFGKGNLLQKAKQQPDKVRMVIEKVRTDGLLQTLDTVRSKLDQALPMGYCNVGEVVEVGPGITKFRVGDRVVSNGKHAERIVVPENLCARIPDGVDDESAVFTVLGAIALHGVRLAEPTIGETVCVIGLGLVGLLTAQILLANGCIVIGFDFDQTKVKLAMEFGVSAYALNDASDRYARVLAFTEGTGADAVIVAASTASSEPMQEAVRFCRKKGRVVQVGMTGMDMSRTDMFEKEVSVQVSCSYGPGRYDPFYEEQGNDYPLSYVRWTEQRNFQAVLNLLKAKKINVRELITHQFDISQAQSAYDLISGSSASLGIVINYHSSKSQAAANNKILLSDRTKLRETAPVKIAFIGAGNYAVQTLFPAFQSTDAELVSVASNTGVTAMSAAKKFNIQEATTSAEELFERDDVNSIVIATRHDTHAQFVCKALQAGKNVFVEKPLALDEQQLRAIEQAYVLAREKNSTLQLMVGFNRRFSPHVIKAKQLLAQDSAPKSIVYMVNAGAISANHWTQSSEVGGGRIIGEACHFIDLLRYLTDSEIVRIRSSSCGDSKDSVTITMGFSDGSLGTIHYFSSGHRSFPKERVEIFSAGKIIQIDNFRKLKLFGDRKYSESLWRQDKGNKACVAHFVHALSTGRDVLIPFSQLCEVSRATIQAKESLSSVKTVDRSPEDWF